MDKFQRSRYIVPNMFTSLNFLLGVWAIILSTDSVMKTENSLLLAGWFIIYCVLFDKLDGFAAKVMKASSEFGAQFDSLADLVAFGIAPALLTLFSYSSFSPAYFEGHRLLVFFGVSLYVLCAALRLARYNAIDVGEADSSVFIGMPSTFAGATNALTIILYNEYDLFNSSNALLQRLPIIILIATAILMVSNFTLPKLLKRKNKIFNGFQITCIILAYVFGVAQYCPEFLASIIVVYFSVGMVHSNLIAKNS